MGIALNKALRSKIMKKLRCLQITASFHSISFLPISLIRNSDCDHDLHHYTLTINQVTLPARGNVSSDRPFSERSETL